MDCYKRIVVVSGINGCGKTTFIDQLKDVFAKRGVSVDVWKAPYYNSESGKLI